MNETELERTAARLGEQAARTLDAERIAERVMARLEGPQVIGISRRPVVRWVLGLAAAAMLMVAVGLALSPENRPVNQSAMTGTVLPELDGLGVDQLEQLLQSWPASSSTLEQESGPSPELDTLSLKRLLRTLEG
jgi:hypothetical protein